jgi:uncharacterized protein
MNQQHETARNEAFGYLCRACSRCCYHKRIQVNPYEIARLARRTGQSAAQLRATSTEDGQGTFLKQKDDGACIFLGAQGCSVHPDRPLVCRLYPLGRRSLADGTEEWIELAPHPQTEGEYSRNGTIGGFIAAQGALPFIAAADGYAQWVRHAAAALESDAAVAADAPDDLLDMDLAIAAYCAARGKPEPQDVDERRDLHMRILYRYLEQVTGGNDGNPDE